MTIRAIIYARVSTEAQRENYSIPEQVKSCLEYIKKKGYVVVGNRFVDPKTGADIGKKTEDAIPAYVDSFSGESYPRPIISEALDYYDFHGFDVVVIRHPDRLARDPIVKAQAIYDFTQLREARFEYVEGGFDDTPEGILASDILTLFAKQENARRAARTKAGKIEKAKRDLFVCGRAPYGYKIDKDVPGGLEIINEQAKVVKYIFDLYTEQHHSIRKIVDILNEEKFIPQKGGKWAKSTVGHILRNSTYAGFAFYNKNKVLRDKIKNKKILKTRPKDEWIKIQGIQPIINAQQFQKAQKRLAYNKELIRRQPKRIYLLSGMIFCSNCHRVFVCQTQIPSPKNRRIQEGKSYRHRLSEDHCGNKHISAGKIDNYVWERIVRLLVDPDIISMVHEDILSKSKQKYNENMNNKQSIQQSIEKFNTQLENLNRAYIDPDIGLTKNEYINQRKEIEARIASCLNRIEVLDSTSSPMISENQIQNLIEFSKSVREKLITENPSITLGQRREILQTLDTKVYISMDGEIEIEVLGSIWL